jgi:hypothetical protein
MACKHAWVATATVQCEKCGVECGPPHLANARAQGAAEERARIVAWLRGEGQNGITAWAIRAAAFFADAIERGEGDK